MQLQNINIFSTGGFIFFLLIILVGYLWVEIVFGKKYIFRHIFDNYKNSLFDRMIHYIVWGFLVNLTFFVVFYSLSGPEYLKLLIDDSGKTALALEPIIGKENTVSAQFVLISIIQFLLMFTMGVTVWVMKEIMSIPFKFLDFLEKLEKEKKGKKKGFFGRLRGKFWKKK